MRKSPNLYNAVYSEAEKDGRRIGNAPTRLVEVDPEEMK